MSLRAPTAKCSTAFRIASLRRSRRDVSGQAIACESVGLNIGSRDELFELSPEIFASRRSLGFALPKSQHTVALLAEQPEFDAISSDVCLELLQPKGRV